MDPDEEMQQVLERIDEKLGFYFTRNEEILRDLTEIVKDHGITLHGKPPGHEGLVLRFDRIEQQAHRRNWLQRTTAGAALAAAFGWLVNLFRNS